MDYTNLCLGCMEEKGEAKICPHCGYKEGTSPESLLHLSTGTVLQNKYLLGRVLGQGGFGITYLAWDKTLNIKLAIKEYLPQHLAIRSAGQSTVTVYKSSLGEEFRYGLNRFLEEARTLARFNEHPNIVTVRDYFEANNTAYLVMNHHEGVTLQNYLASKGGKIPVEQALAIFMPVLDALKEVHAAGILHRDISPDNLLISNRGRVILIDFGAARQAIGGQSRSLSVIMKPGFSPEEQYHSKGKQGPWTDIYAVAASIYCTITGTAPPESLSRLSEDTLEAPSKLGVKIDPPLEKALLKAMAVRAKDRYQAVEIFQEEVLGSQVNPGMTVITERKECPYCGKEISAKAIKCKYCQSMLDEKTTTPEATANKKKSFVEKQSGRAKDNTSLNSKKVIGYIVAFIAIGLLLFGGISLFGGGDLAADIVDETVDEPAVEFEGDVLIGIMVPTTGSEAADGIDMENAALLAVEEINARGGVLGHRLVTTTGNDGCDPSMATAAASQLVAEEVVALVGGYCSGATLPTLAIYGNAGIPFVVAASNARALIDENPGWAFMINSTGLDQAANAVEKFIDLGVETIGVIDSGDAYSADLKAQTILQWEEARYEVVADDTVQRGQVDFSAFVTKIMATQPDAIYWTGYQAEGALLIRQLREGGYKGVIMVGDGSSAQELIDLAGPAAEGVLCTGSPLTYFLPAAQSFIQNYEESFLREPGAYAALMYDATMLLADAIERAGSFDSAAIRDSLEATDGFEGLAGPIMFTPQNTRAKSNFVIIEARNGRWALVE